MHRQFLENYLKMMIMFNYSAMIKEVLLISLVVNGFYIIIHDVDSKKVSLHKYK